MSLLVKALLLLWPFARVAIFGERKISRVLLDNIHTVIIFGCVLLLCSLTTLLYFRYDDVKSENVRLKAELIQVCITPEVSLKERRRKLGDLLK